MPYELADYEYVMEELANDRDDSNDPEYRDADGYCEHGRYVGGCGIDWMCEWCEAGISAGEARRIVAAERLAKTRERAGRAYRMLGTLLRHRVGGIDAAHMAQESSYIMNPLSRYGRH